MTLSLAKSVKVFISYSHKDRKALERLQVHLSPFIMENQIDLWDDSLITPGAEWRTEIKNAIEIAEVAILLVSADSLSSPFINEHEMAPIVALAERNGTRIIPVILSPCAFERTKLAQFQSMNPPSEPLSHMTKHHKEALWKRLADVINDITLRPLASQKSSTAIGKDIPKTFRFKVSKFISYIKSYGIDYLVEQRFLEVLNENLGEDKKNFWKGSLNALVSILDDLRFDNAEIFFEYQLPLCSARCNILLLGRDASKDENAVILEIKPWNYVIADTNYKIFSDYGRVIHPSEQIKAYSDYLRYYNQAFDEQHIHVSGCTFLHNVKSLKEISALSNPSLFSAVIEKYPVYTLGEIKKLQDYLFDRIGQGEGESTAENIQRGHIKPNMKYLKVMTDILLGNVEWRLLDEQILIFNLIVSKVQEALYTSSKHVLIVSGDPGTGKSALAMQLLAFSLKNNWSTSYSTGSLALRTVFRAKIAYLKKNLTGHAKDGAKIDLFSSFSEIARLGLNQEDSLDLALFDEAHRLWDFRRNRFNGLDKKMSDVPMSEELIKAARVCVFFLDDRQAVRSEEIGTVESIWDKSISMNVPSEVVRLHTQFRCSGSTSYINWIDYSLGYSDHKSLNWKSLSEYDFKIVDSMPEMQKRLDEHQATGNTCRFVAGFCWPWSKPMANGRLVFDLQDDRFGEWKAPWIERTGIKLPPLEHQYFKWATDEDYYSQVGSIYSIQGFEFDYIGLIFGEDLIWSGEKWEYDLNKNKDKVFKRGLSTSNQNVLEKLRNIYRVLLTRGLKGTYVFFLNEETKNYFRRLMS